MNPFACTGGGALRLPEIDVEHHVVYRLAGEAWEALETGAPPPQVKQLFAELAEAGAAHFSHEERLMRKAGYPSLAWHKDAHDAVRARLAASLPKVEAGDLDAARRFLEYLHDWLDHHTALADRLMAAYLRNRARAA